MDDGPPEDDFEGILDFADAVTPEFTERVRHSIQARETIGHAGELSFRLIGGLFELLGMVFSVFTAAERDDEGED